MKNLHVLLCLLFASAAVGTDFSPSSVRRINIENFAKESKEGHIMPPSAFFLQQLKNMCHEYEYESLAYYLCSHLTEGQRYVVPILDFHEDDGKGDHVFMVELMPQKVYYHADSPVAMTSMSDSLDRELQVLVPKQHVPVDRLSALADKLAQTAR